MTSLSELTTHCEMHTVATYPLAGERGEAHGCVFQRRKMRRVATNVYLWKTRRKSVMKNIPDSGVVFTFEENAQSHHQRLFVSM